MRQHRTGRWIRSIPRRHSSISDKNREMLLFPRGITRRAVLRVLHVTRVHHIAVAGPTTILSPPVDLLRIFLFLFLLSSPQRIWPCSRQRMAELPTARHGAPVGRRRCSPRRTTMLPYKSDAAPLGRRWSSMEAGGGAPLGRRRCSTRPATMLPAARHPAPMAVWRRSRGAEGGCSCGRGRRRCSPWADGDAPVADGRCSRGGRAMLQWVLGVSSEVSTCYMRPPRLLQQATAVATIVYFFATNSPARSPASLRRGN